MKVYGTITWGTSIEEKEVVRMTDKSIFYLTSKGKEYSERMVSNYRHWHKTKEEAISFLIDRTQMKLKSRKEEIQKLQSELNTLINLSYNINPNE